MKVFSNMKNKYIIFGLLCVALSGSSCKKYFEGINDNPNQPENVTPDVLLASSEAHLAYAIAGDISRYTTVWMQQGTGFDRQMAVAGNYSVLAGDFDNVWGFNLYGGPLNDLVILNQMAKEKDYKTYAGISKILLAYGMGIVTDCWGNVPYSNAFKGADNLKPSFDTQESVYTMLLALCDSAINDLSAADPGPLAPGGDDFIYGGDVVAWTMAANVLKAKLYLHLGLIDNANYGKALTALGVEGTDCFGANSDDCQFNFGGTETSAGPWYQFNSQRGDIDFTGNLLDQMIATGDPRLDSYIDTTGGDAYMAGFYGDLTSPFIFMSFAEQKFIESEAAFKSNNPGRAATAFNEGVRASLAKHGASDAAWEGTYANEDGISITLEKIIGQKYVALFTHPEVWTDWRRTGFPTLSPTPGNVTGGIIPTRFPYPLGEQKFNSGNCPIGVPVTAKVWWDAN